MSEFQQYISVLRQVNARRPVRRRRAQSSWLYWLSPSGARLTMRKQVFIVLSILLAIAAAITARAASPALFEYLVAPAGPGNQRNSEGDMLLLKGGRLLLAWIDFYTDGRSDWSAARISAMISRDQGRTWGPKFTLQENIGRMNVMEPDLLRLTSGKVLFIFARKNSEADCQPMVRISTDDARTFSPPKPMPIDPYPSY